MKRREFIALFALPLASVAPQCPDVETTSTGRRIGWVDPKKEVEAHMEQIRANWRRDFAEIDRLNVNVRRLA